MLEYPLIRCFGVVVFLVGAGTREGNGFFAFLAVFDEMPVEELMAVVGIEAAKREGQRSFNVFDLFKVAAFTCAPDSALFDPASGDVHGIKSTNELSGGRSPAVRDSIYFDESWFRFFPLPCFNRDVIAQKSSGLGGRESNKFVFATRGLE